MQQELQELLAGNQRWAESARRDDPTLFERLADGQAPRFLWVGCSDSRVPPTQLTGAGPGALFVHRNIANVVAPTDLNLLSVLQYAVDALKVRHVIVCGHYGCGGVEAALHNRSLGLIDNWLRHIQVTRDRHAARLQACSDPVERFRRLCELNVIEQVVNLCHTSVVQGAWARGQPLTVHGLIYELSDGRLHDLELSVGGPSSLLPQYEQAIAALG